jgi:hypothetical protein
MRELALLGLSTYRLTKLVIDDEILKEPRQAILSRLYASGNPAAAKAAYLLTCPWCVSIWAAGGLLLLKKLSPDAADAIELGLSASAVTGVLAERVA